MESQVRYLAIVSESPDRLAAFYSSYFAMRELGRSAAGDVALTDALDGRWRDGDGHSAGPFAPRHERKRKPEDGLNHFGWLVNDIEHFLDSLPEGCISKRPSSRPMAEHRGFDPDRNPFDVSQDKGYKIDVGRWVHG
jgi:hypothetical protein